MRGSEGEKDLLSGTTNVITRNKSYGRDAGTQPIVNQRTPDVEGDAPLAQNETDELDSRSE